MMDAGHVNQLKETLLTFKSHAMDLISRHYSGLRQELEVTEAYVTGQFNSRLERVEAMMTGPYDRDLVWEWDSNGGNLMERMVRLQELPGFVISGKDLFEKYVVANEARRRVLQQLEYYLPPNTPVFQRFLQAVTTGSKQLLPTSQLKHAEIPEDQVLLAYRRLPPLPDLQSYLPDEPAIASSERQYILDIVNSLQGLTYKPILPLTSQEQSISDCLRLNVQQAVSTLNRLKVNVDLSELKTQVEMKSCSLEVSGFLRVFGECVEQLEAQDMAVE